MNSKTLYIFTIDFPYKNGEPFLKQELNILAENFKKIIIFPLDLSSHKIAYSLPANVEIEHINIFSPYNRVKLFLKEFFFITGTMLREFVQSPYRFNYIARASTHLNQLLTRTNAAKELGKKLPKREVVTAYTYWFNQWTFILSILNHKQGNISLYTRIHGMDVYEQQHTAKDFFFPFRYFQEKNIKEVWSISTNGLKHLIQQSPQFANKVVVRRLGVSDHGLNPENKTGELVLVSCSALQKYKRVHLIPEILKGLDIDVRWIHFGDGEERARVERGISELPANIKANLMGHVSSDELMKFYASHPVDLFINVSETEGIPVSIMEAMSFGIPCLAPKVGGISEIVNNSNGYLIDKEFDIKIISDHIYDFKKLDHSKKKDYRHEALMTWKNKFNIKNNSLSLLEALNT